MGLNVAEAINVGSDAWNLGNELKMLCPCKMCKIEHAETNIDVDMSVKVGKPKARSHRCDTCRRIFGTKKLLMKHKKTDHGSKLACRDCYKQFNHSQSLNRHIRMAHGTGTDGNMRPTLCSICSKSTSDIVRHKRDKHLTLVECSGCRTNFTRYDLVQHEKTCVDFRCTCTCGKNFKSRRSLAIHLTKWCDKEESTS